MVGRKRFDIRSLAQRCRRPLLSLLVVGLSCCAAQPLEAQAAGQTMTGQWVATWTAAQQFAGENPSAPRAGFENQTVRMVVHTSIGGHTVRVHLSNTFGVAPLVVGGVHLAMHGADSSIVQGSDHAVTFNGKLLVVVPAGAPMISDPVAMEVPVTGDLVVSVYLPKKTGVPTWHALGLQTTYISGAAAAGSGDLTGAITMPGATTASSWFFLSEVDVQAAPAAYAIVATGDSITDGAQSTPNTNQRWPNLLAARLLAGKNANPVAVVDEAISGNRILHDIAGPNALARLDREAWTVAGARTLIVLEGINDLGYPNIANAPYGDQVVTADDVIGAMRQIIERAHAQGVRVIGGTLTPYVGATYATPEGEAKREAINQWIRTSNAFDGVIDFEAAVRDPQNPARFAPAYDSGDHLHPSDAGYKRMAESVDIQMLERVSEAPLAGNRPK